MRNKDCCNKDLKNCSLIAFVFNNKSMTWEKLVIVIYLKIRQTLKITNKNHCNTVITLK